MKNKILTMLLGYPLAGKTTYAEKNLAGKSIIISADMIRQQMLGLYYYEKAEQMIWEKRYYMLDYLLRQDVDIAIDETNLLFDRRMETVTLARGYCYKINYVHLATPYEICKQRIQEKIDNAITHAEKFDKIKKKVAMEGMHVRGFEQLKPFEYDSLIELS